MARKVKTNASGKKQRQFMTKARTAPAGLPTTSQTSSTSLGDITALFNIAQPQLPEKAEAWPYRKAVFVHGMEWLFNKELKGYSQDLQTGILSKLPSDMLELFDKNTDFVEVLWSDIVETDERRIIAGLEIVGYIASGNFPLAVKAAVNELKNNENVPLLQPENLFGTFLSNLLPGKDLPGLSLAENAASALLDVMLYFTQKYGEAIRQEIRRGLEKAQSEAGAPAVFAHSLGSVAIIDIIREDLAKGGPLSVGRLITAGSPLGLFEADKGDKEGFESLAWENYYDPKDFASPWNPLKSFGFDHVKDWSIKVEVLPALGHLNYWKSETTASAMLSKIFSEDK